MDAVQVFFKYLDLLNEFTEPYARKFLNEELGGWPLASGSANPFSPLDLLKRLIKYGFSRVVSFYISANPEDPLQYIIKVKN